MPGGLLIPARWPAARAGPPTPSGPASGRRTGGWAGSARPGPAGSSRPAPHRAGGADPGTP